MKRIAFLMAVAAAGCGGGSTDDGGTSADLATAGADLAMAGADLAMGPGADLAMGGGGDIATAPDLAPPCPPAPYKEDVSACKPAPTDYQPRDNMSKNDTWPACISDGNVFKPIQPNSISTIARIKAFEDIAKKLWDGGKTPMASEFGDAKILYLTPEGLDSRVQRRQDIHYPELPMGQACNQMGVPQMHPDRCAGPVKILPILNDAFAKGAAGDKVLVQAARIEVSLLWFLYLAVLSESWSTATSPKDVDSMWAYYGGGNDRASPLGLGKYVKALGGGTHDRIYDGLLAVRCWRNLDNEMGTAMDLATGDKARAQLDKALVRGMALILRQRLGELRCASGDKKEAHFAFVQILGGFLGRAARAIDVGKADMLKAQVGAASADKVDTIVAQSALDALFPCP